MKPRIIKTNAEKPGEEILEAAEYIKQGKLVAFPTETVYGLGADALNEKAVRRIFEVKGRPADNPLIVHVSRIEQIYEIAEPNDVAEELIEKFFPGPLTLVMKNKKVPKIVTAGLETVAIRMPNHKVALKLIDYSSPIAAPSANKSGKPSPTKAEHVLEDFNGEIECIIDAGETIIGLESTVVDTTVYPLEILRPGGVTKEEIERYFEVRFAEEVGTPKSPGMKYRHYAPKAELIVLVGDGFFEKALEVAKNFEKRGKRVGIAGLGIKGENCFNLGDSLQDFAKNLFKALRELDKKCDLIIMQGVEEKGLGKAIMNRLKKAGKIYRI
ncbi:MAG: L-threonylcarbamoyladenylate synthase [Archaeoglobales archaeon]|nr:L-threonylcarbamoyladenylate synthase [Archaeoglobales archaeon]